MSDDAATQKMCRQAAQTLESLARAGVTHAPRKRKPAAAAPSAAPQSIDTPAAPEVPTPPRTATLAVQQAALAEIPSAALRSESRQPAMSVEERVAALRVIQTEVAGCMRCDELARTRTQTVFGVGNPQARLVFCGEAPGADEDRQGEPFVGRAGQLLTRIIEACTLTRADVYILNVLKCRPPSNRTPLPAEVANCRGYLDRQLEIIRPEFICCLGSVAAHTLLETETPIGRLRGHFQEYRGIPVLCTYHPAYLLRNPDAKRFVWDDMKLLMARMGIELAK